MQKLVKKISAALRFNLSNLSKDQNSQGLVLLFLISLTGSHSEERKLPVLPTKTSVRGGSEEENIVSFPLYS